ncbi:hypothetical protein QAD02_020365 [Eretmocerus hayati]|uniref:Uncharacterized protein n=2 Tax=Eretmocerus hayati TaxID=131215 RepID=A0ACC2PN97_9HYME|nr:hypothetical protein QAD02_020300 [Eretmocerus hayati]KAJ8684573.1 hypothetical protein QAD02_020365 [Eretmocerus hayati]
MADIYGTICLMEKDILAAFRELTRKNVSLRERKRIRNSRKIEKGAYDLFEIIKGVLERIKQNSKPEWTGKKEALESKADRMLRIFKILNERRHRRQLNNVIFFESKTAFKRRARTAVVGNVDHIVPSEFMKEAALHIIPYVESFLQEHKSAKVSLIFDAYYCIKDEKREIKHFKTPYIELLISSDLQKWYEKNLKTIDDQLSEFEEVGSGWSLEEIISLKINIIKTRPLNGASYIELPEFIKKKHAVVNIECGGNQCFAHSVMAGLYPAKNGSSSQNKLHSYPHWKNKEMGLKLREEDFPISYADIPQFEKDNDISINVYEVDEQEETIYGSYRTTKKRIRHVNLLLLEDEDGAHYCTIKHLSRLISSGINKDMHKRYVCETCFHSFSSEKKLNRHSLDCKTANECKIVLPRPEEAVLRFTNHWKKQDSPYIVYADFECLLIKMNQELGQIQADGASFSKT